MRYDGGYGRGGGGWRGDEYGPDFGGYGPPPRPPYGRRGPPPPPPRTDWGGVHRGYDRGFIGRGEYGDAYPGFGGGYGPPRGYDGGYARGPFMPDEAYRRHPEYSQRTRGRQWEAFQHGVDDDLDDGQVCAAVRRRMENDAWLDPQRITIDVDDGIVTLTGEVDDFLEARYAWDDAWEAPGVRGVVNNLTVRTDEPNDLHGDMLPQSSGARTDAG